MTKTVRSVIDDLVQRRLWPLAVLLVIAIVAVPLLLSKHGTTPSTAAAPLAPADSGATADVAVAAAAGTSDTPASGRALSHLPGVDPFVQRGAKPKTTGGPADTGSASTGSQSTGSEATGSEATGASTTGSSSSSTFSASGTGNSGGGSSVPSSSATTPSASGTDAGSSTGSGPSPTPRPAPKPAPAPTPKPKIAKGPSVSINVAFGRLSGHLVRHRNLHVLTPLPRAGDAAAIFLKVEGKRTAVFTVAPNVDAKGDGHCRPTGRDCRYLRMRAGDTEFLEVKPSSGSPIQYRLDLKAVHVRRTEAKASAASADATAKHDATFSPTDQAGWDRLVKRLQARADSGFGDVKAGLDAVGAGLAAPTAP